MSADRATKVRATAARGQGNPLLKAALAYAKRGWHVFPLNGKIPFPGTHGHKDATTDPEQIKQWWREWPDANIGIRCDDLEGPIILDCDGPEAKVALKEFGIDPDDYPRVSSNPTKRKQHLYVDPPAKLPKDGLPRIIALREKFDVLGRGGYVIAPPSIHADTGKPYTWLRSPDGVDLPPLPVSIVKAIKAKKAEGRDATGGQLPDTIPEGERDNTLTSLAGSMRRRNASPEAVLAALREENAARCIPPLADRQVRKIARSAESFAPAPLVEPPTGWHNITIAGRFAEQEKATLRWCPTMKTWLAWDGMRWAHDGDMSVQTRLKDHILGILSLAIQADDDDLRKCFGNYTQQHKLKALEITARDNLKVALEKLDTDPWLLNVRNGTLDLRTARVSASGRLHVTLLPHDPAQLLTKLAPVTYDPAVECPEWNGFLDIVLRQDADIDWDDALATVESDAELERYAQELAGLSLTGDVRDDTLIFAHGDGGGGKSTFMNALQALLGDYAVTIKFETLLQQRGGGASEADRDIARLAGARAAFASEVPEGQRWNLGIVKQLTGGDYGQRGRRLYQEAFEFKPTAKLWCRANDKPAAYDPSNALWRRMRVLPFEHPIPEAHQDKALRGRLIEPDALTGILNWALIGLARWRERGQLPVGDDLPPRVRTAITAYRAEQVDDHPAAPFLADCCRINPKQPEWWTPTTVLHGALEKWWREHRSGQRLPTPTLFGRALKLYGLTTKARRVEGKRSPVRGWCGIRLRVVEE